MLHHPRKNGKYVIYSDASDYAIGSILYQEDENGALRVIAYASRVFKGAEKHYFTSEKEILAIVYALSKFRVYVFGTHFEIHTDHQALTFLMKCRITNARLMRWILAISEYSFTIKYCKGVDNTIADTLSRYIVDTREEVYVSSDKNIKILNIEYDNQQEVEELLQNIGAEQDKDANVLRLKGNPLKNNYMLQNNILYKLMNHEWKVVLTNEMLQTLIKPCHQSLAHASALKCYLALREDFTVNNMCRKIKKILRSCHECQTAKHPNLHTYVPMQSIKVRRKGELVAMDFLGPLPRSGRGVSNILVILDVFTKNVQIHAVRFPTSKAVLNIIRKKYIPEHGAIEKIVTDQGKQFTSRIWMEGLGNLGIRPILTSIRHPQANPVERVNKEIGKLLRIYCHQHHNRWADYIKYFEKVINANYSEATGFTPLELSKGKKPERIWTRHIHKPSTQNLSIPLQQKNEYASQRMVAQAAKRIERYNRIHKLTQFDVNDRVLVRGNPVGKRIDRTAKKMFRIYEGPYILQTRKGPQTFIVYDDVRQRVIGKYHSESLRHYIEE